MIKKAAVLLCSIFVFSSFAVAQEAPVDKAPKEKTEKAVSMKKEKDEFHNEMRILVEKYNNASEQEQNSIRNSINTLVSEFTEKDLSAKKARLAKDKEKIAKLEKEITGIEADRQGHINKKVDYYLSAEGQKKLIEPNKKDEKKSKKSK